MVFLCKTHFFEYLTLFAIDIQKKVCYNLIEVMEIVEKRRLKKSIIATLISIVLYNSIILYDTIVNGHYVLFKILIMVNILIIIVLLVDYLNN